MIANKVQDEEDEGFVRSKIPAEELWGIVHHHRSVMDADRRGLSPFDVSPETVREIAAIKGKMEIAVKENGK